MKGKFALVTTIMSVRFQSCIDCAQGFLIPADKKYAINPVWLIVSIMSDEQRHNFRHGLESRTAAWKHADRRRVKT